MSDAKLAPFDDKPVQVWFNTRPFDRAKNIREIDLVIDAAAFQHSQDQAALAKLTEKCERYRAALEQIAGWPVQPGMSQIARAALEQTDE